MIVLSEYDDLLKEVKGKAAAFQSTAREYVPKMYLALRNENHEIPAADARDRIEKDCAGIWSRRTILDALPDEAKNPEKQKAGRLGQTKRNSAAFSAAPQTKNKIIIDNQGRSVADDSEGAVRNGSAFVDSKIKFEKFKQDSSNKEIKSGLEECSSCKNLCAKNQELEEALRKATTFSTADTIIAHSPSDPEIILESDQSDNIDFEFSLLLGEISRHLAALYPKIGDGGKVYFSGKVEKDTGNVLSARIGRIADHNERQ